ncbi:MAG TPA: UdgX family uracil-DNA binding protein [Thermoanaerobaculia bacterium]|nr:UdgX family uracil-DNA binding protein [Thermoanaerobaculia bacterium]
MEEKQNLWQMAPPEAWRRAEVPLDADLPALEEAASACRSCPLHANATQTVFGDGPADARIVFVGEQPGDREDLEGLPFVGPAGKLLDRALEEAGIERKSVYVTNVVKHFKWEPRGKKRIHAKPGSRDVKACRPWLEAELHAVAPEILVCLGATAAAAILGSEARVERDRGRFMASPHASATLVTIHPSALLRERDEEARKRAYARFVADLRVVAAYARKKPHGKSPSRRPAA